MRWCSFTNELTYLVLISSLGIAVGDVTLVLSPLMYNLQDEYGAVKKTLKDILTINTCAHESCGRGVVVNVFASHEPFDTRGR